MFVWIPTLILLAGALLLAAGRRLRFRYAPVLAAPAALSAGLAIAAWIGARPGALPHSSTILAWRPLSWFGMPLSLRLDEYAWVLGLVALLPILASSLWWLARSEGAPAHAPLVLVIGASVLWMASAANVLTLALSWGLLDFAHYAALLVGDDQAGGHRSRLTASRNSLATLLAWMIVVFLEQDQVSPYWHLMAVPPLARALLGLAAVLRILPQPGGDASRPLLPDLLPAMAGLTLWVRLAVIQAIPEEVIWVWGGLAGALWGGLMAWCQPAGQRSIFYSGIGYAGLLVVAGSAARLSAASLARGTVTWLLAMYVLTLSCAFVPSSEPGSLVSRIRQKLPALPALAALVALLGSPATLAWADRLALHAALSQARGSWWLLVILAETLLAGAVLRAVLAVYQVLPAWPAPVAEPGTLVPDSESNQPEPGPVPAQSPQPAPTPAPVLALRRLASLGACCIPLVGLLTVILPLFAWSVWPAALPDSSPASQGLGVRVWIGWLVPWVGMIVLALGAAYLPAILKVPPSLLRGGRALGAILDLAWLDALVFNNLQRVARLAGGLGTLIEGRAALIWTMLILVLALLYVR
jgi:hypothetical protein